MNKTQGFLIFLFLISFLSFMDILSTNYAVEHSLGYEANLLMKDIIKNTYLFYSIKLLEVLLLVSIYLVVFKRDKKIATLGTFIVLLELSFVVFNNLTIIHFL